MVGHGRADSDLRDFGLCPGTAEKEGEAARTPLGWREAAEAR